MRILSKHTFLVGLFFILLSGLAAFLNHSGFALRLIVLSFWIIVGGSLLYIFELKNEK
ncbi:MAG: hypothetical protein G01um10147_454 [Microgenomates group bacterium Gr01-1014_7]|nr:MAG: hypothetical protein G01um10147_454 [Microgenomates group bacterium Gr01-1014_7]